MWTKIEQTASAGDHAKIFQAARDINIFNGPIELVDQEVEKNIERLRKSRFFFEFDRVRSSLDIGRLLVDGGSLSAGSAILREQGLAWCARLLSRSEELEKAEEFLAAAKTLGDSPETKIAEAFILSQKGDKAAALQVFADINSHASHSAGLMVVAHHDGAEVALKWMNDAGYTVEDLDSDGKFFLLSHQLQFGYWDEAAQTVGAFSETDFEEAPALHHLAALTKLTAAVPADFRAFVLS